MIFKATFYFIYPQHQHNLKENGDQKKTNLDGFATSTITLSRKIFSKNSLVAAV